MTADQLSKIVNERAIFKSNLSRRNEMYILGGCRTNLDDYRSETWPTIFAAVPREGE